MRCLLEVLRGEAGRRTVDESEWEDAIVLAEEHAVLPYVAEILLQTDVGLPPAIHASLADARCEALQYSFLQTSELRHLLQAFGDANIPVLPIKGPFLAQRIYGAASLRISCDHDLLVPRVYFAKATQLLQSLNFNPDAIPDDYHQKWIRGTTVVELHFDVENPLAMDFDVQSAWKNVGHSEFAGVPTLRFSPHDELRYLCLHAARHRFSRLSYLLDIALAARQVEPRRPSPEARFLDHAESVLVLGCAMAGRLYPEERHLLAPDAGSRLDELAERLWNDLLTEPPTQQDWAAMHRFYLEMEPGTGARLQRRARHLRILLTRLIDDDFRFAARFGLKRRWQVWLLRPMRLALRSRWPTK